MMIPEDAVVQDIPGDYLESVFVFALVWSFGATLAGEDWPRFDSFLRKIANKALPRESLYDCNFNLASGKWVTWESQVSEYAWLVMMPSHLLPPRGFLPRNIM